MLRAAVLVLGLSLLADAEVVAITGATVVDGTGAPARRATVVIDGDRIVAVGPEAAVPGGARVIDGRGHTLLPGLFDLHTHLPYSAVGGVEGDWGKILKAYLACGVTTVADFGTYPETFEPMRRLLRDGVIVGPRLHLAARITTPGGHGAEGGRGDYFSLEVLTPADARAAMARLVPYMPDAIKVFTDGWRYGTAPDMTSMEEETLAAIVVEARKHDLEVMTHTVTLERAKSAARAGVDVIGHGIGDARADEELMKLLRSRRTAYVSTLAVYEGRRETPAFLLGLLDPLAAARVKGRAQPPAAVSEPRRRRWENLTANVALLKGAGARIAVGTDAGVTGALHGGSTLRELELLVGAGLTPLEALTAATGESAAAIHVDGDRGTIKAGKLADLVLVEGAPHEDIRDVERVKLVFLGGREIDPRQMRQAIARPEMTPIPARAAVELIDDVEQSAERTNLGTLRVNATDPGVDNSRMMFQRIARPGGGHALAVQARMANKPRPYAQVWLPLSPGGVEPVDASAFQGIEFEARGEGSYRLLVKRRGQRTGRPPGVEFTARAEWSKVQAPFSKLAAAVEGWSAADLQVVAFEIARGAGEMGWLELDNVRFYR